MPSTVYLIPTILYDGQINCLPTYILDAVKQCSVFFVENERTARRNLKLLWKEMVIDEYEWFNMKEISDELKKSFTQKIKEGKNIGIISEAGCPGIADPGQQLVSLAHQLGVQVKPLVGPNSILLAIMASGMNGQQFQFVGYLPIDNSEKMKLIKQLENESRQKNCTQVFIETPYRNIQLFESLTKVLSPQTRLCVAVDLTSENEMIKTKSVGEWKKSVPELHKRPAIFLLYAGS